MQLSYEKLDEKGLRRKRSMEPAACKISLPENIRANATYMKETWGCKNNAIKSVTLCNAPKNTKITLYDDEELGEQDDYALIEVKDNMDGCVTISTFEETKIYTASCISY